MNESMHRTRGKTVAGSVRSPALVAGTACILLANPAAGIELGALQVESTLGQPLRASISYALGPNEQIADRCVYLRSAAPGNGLPTITRATATLRGNRILLRGNTPLREPLMNLQVTVDCPYTAQLTREFLVLLNPPGSQPETAATPAPVARTAAATPRRATPPAPRRAVAPAAPATPVAAGQRYRVQAGDTLSGIVSRIEGRELRLWAAVDALFAANPQAFRNGDMDQLIAGSELIIPAAVANATPVEQPVTNNIASNAAPATAATSRAYGGAREANPAPAAEPSAPAEPAPAAALPETPAPATAAETPAATASSPFADEAVPEVAAAAEPATPAPVVSIPDTAIRQPEAVAPQPVGASADSPASAWLVWLGGAGVAIVLGLLLFGRRLRERFTSLDDELEDTQVNPAIPQRRRSDRGEPESDNLNLHETMSQASALDVAVDFDTGEHVADDDIDVALDYSFASSGDYTNDVDAVADDATEARPETDILPTMSRNDAIEVTEEPAADDTSSYDMSMVLDVTKQNFDGQDATTRDLQAIEVETLQPDPSQSGSISLTTEFDYKVLEQDYEEELTATQALNKEIEAAARELQDRLGEFDDDQSKISMAEDLEGTAEVTAEMPNTGTAGNDPRDEATDVNEELTARLPDSDDATVEMPPREDGSTVEMNPALDETVERKTRTG